jgi:hypothetical protein
MASTLKPKSTINRKFNPWPQLSNQNQQQINNKSQIKSKASTLKPKSTRNRKFNPWPQLSNQNQQEIAN